MRGLGRRCRQARKQTATQIWQPSSANRLPALPAALPAALVYRRNVMYHGDSRITALPPYLTVQVGGWVGGCGARLGGHEVKGAPAG